MKTDKTFTMNKSQIPTINCYRALVVDDYAPAKKLLSASLSTLPHIGEIEFADNGEEALKKVESKRYDIIFLDVTMPGLDGFETCTLIREIKGYEMTPIIIITGNTSPGHKFKSVISGSTSYLTKPIKQETFRQLNLQLLSWLQAIQAA